MTSTDPSIVLRRQAQVGGLYAAVLRLQRGMMETQVDTEGQVSSLSSGAWNDLLTLAEPHIRAGIHASACPISEVDDCYQEAWLAVLGKIHLVDPDPERGSLGVGCVPLPIARLCVSCAVEPVASEYRRSRCFPVLNCLTLTPWILPPYWPRERQRPRWRRRLSRFEWLLAKMLTDL